MTREFWVERVTRIELALSAWEVSSAIRDLRAATLIRDILARLAASDRESPPGLTPSGTYRHNVVCANVSALQSRKAAPHESSLSAATSTRPDVRGAASPTACCSPWLVAIRWDDQ